MKSRYEIEMTVPLGVRKGTMTFEETHGNVNGTIDILGSTTTFSGKMEDCRFEISGTLKTKIREIAYTGQGNMEGALIWIQLKNEKGMYKVTGHKSP